MLTLMLPEFVLILSSAGSSAGLPTAAGSGTTVILTLPDVVERSIRSYKWCVPVIELEPSCWTYFRLDVPGGRPGLMPGGGVGCLGGPLLGGMGR